MTKPEFKRAFAIAEDFDIKLGDHDMFIFDGFGLADFDVVYVTLSQIARLIRYQCLFLDGTWDSKAMQEIGYFGKRKFMVVG